MVVATPLPSLLGVVSVHAAFVFREAGAESSWVRYEVWESQRPEAEAAWGHVHKNLFPRPLGYNPRYSIVTSDCLNNSSIAID